ncbi:hypothetical protein GCM10023160_01410 [Brachybacterium paraconglomeratum]|uniref:DUF4064 domain-containing protein n=1 Tax=Brachybacterium paraconglomeratum TaxID=173362 RepID=UPI0031F00E96
MSTMTEPCRAGRSARPGSPSRSAEQAAPRVSRTVELWLVGIGMAVSFLALGGFALVMNRIDAATFEQVVMPALVGAEAESGLGVAEAHELARTLAAWFSVTLIAVLLLSAIGWFVARRRPWRRTAGWWFLAAGLACLLGSQLILFPVAFIFFVAAGFFALRPVTDGSPS